LEKTAWNVTQASKLLGISRDTLRYRIEEVQTDAVFSMMRPQPSNDRQEASEWEGNLPVHPSFGSLLRLPWLATPGGGS
jgi:hypothetical protein